MTNKFYAIRHKPSGGLMPRNENKQTSVEPSSKLAPKLFNSRKSANYAKARWVRSEYQLEFDTMNLPHKPTHYIKYDENDLEVIEIKITVVDND